jgi:hypothetical protein
MRKFNEWLAVRATLAFGNMWTTYLFFLYGFLPILFPAAMDKLLYWSNTVQLWSLPLLMVGQHILGRAAEKRAQEDHEAIMAELAEIREMHEELHQLVKEVNPLRKVVEHHEHHPHFGHTMANKHMEHHNHPLSLRGPVVHVKGTVKKVEDDAIHHGVGHLHFLISIDEILSIEGASADVVKGETFCAVRYGDHMGLSKRIEDLKEGEPIEMQGEYIDRNHAYHSIGNPGDPVLHFTHHPVGFVIYGGKRYE